MGLLERPGTLAKDRMAHARYFEDGHTENYRPQASGVLRPRLRPEPWTLSPLSMHLHDEFRTASARSVAAISSCARSRPASPTGWYAGAADSSSTRTRRSPSGRFFRTRSSTSCCCAGDRARIRQVGFPGGYVDRGEQVIVAAVREAREEAGLDVRVDRLLNVYSYPGGAPVIIVYVASIVGGTLTIDDESTEAKFFHPDGIPWDELAFSSTQEALREFLGRP